MKGQGPGTVTYFLEEYIRFRDIFGDRSFSVDQMQAAFNGLWHLYLRTEIPEGRREALSIAMQAASHEWTRRRLYMEVGV